MEDDGAADPAWPDEAGDPAWRASRTGLSPENLPSGPEALKLAWFFLCVAVPHYRNAWWVAAAVYMCGWWLIATPVGLYVPTNWRAYLAMLLGPAVVAAVELGWLRARRRMAMRGHDGF